MRTNRAIGPKLGFQMSAGGVFVVINLVGDVELHGQYPFLSAVNVGSGICFVTYTLPDAELNANRGHLVTKLGENASKGAFFVSCHGAVR